MPSPNFSGGLATLGAGFPGVGPTGTTTDTSGTNESNNMTQGNTNYFNSENFTTWLSSLVNGLVESANNTTSTTKYNIDPATQALIDKLTGQYSALSTPFDSQRYQASQIQGINANNDLQKQAVQNVMAARGVSGPAAATAEANIDNARFGQINQMQQQVPFLANEWNKGNLNAAANFMSMIPKGTTTTGMSNTSTSSTQSSNQSGNQVRNNAGGSTFYNDGWQKGTNSSTSSTRDNTPSWMKGVGMGAAVLASLFSDKTLKKDIEEITPDKAIKNILALKPSTWNWTKDDSKDMGVIAQDLQKVIPELVHKDPEGSGKLKVNYAGLISQLVGAVQAINRKVEATA
jgi:hypothetical protein